MWEENPCTMLIRRLYLSLARLSNRILHQHDLTMSQLMTLLLLSGSSEKELSLKELERLLQTSQPDVAGIASRLEKKGLVTRFPDAADRGSSACPSPRRANRAAVRLGVKSAGARTPCSPV